MPSIMCKCEYLIDVGEIPSPHRFLLVSDTYMSRVRQDLAKRLDQAQTPEEEFDPYERLSVSNPMFFEVLLCPNCGRLNIYDGRGDLRMICKPEIDAASEWAGQPELGLQAP